MTEQEVREVLEKCGAMLNGHFVLTSGKHADTYVNKDALYPHIKETRTLCREIALKAESLKPDIVVGPATGGIVLSQWIAYYLTKFLEREVLAVYADKILGTKNFVFKRNYDKLLKDKKVFVVEDVLTSGTSAGNVVKAVRDCGGFVVGVGALCNRGMVTTREVGDVAKFFALLNLNLESYPPNDCPLCREGISIDTKVGKG